MITPLTWLVSNCCFSCCPELSLVAAPVAASLGRSLSGKEGLNIHICLPAMSSLNVVALVSGGKDSLYSIIHCIQNGHTVVALANLYPLSVTKADGSARVAGYGDGDGDGDDLNSFMYQTVGHSVIPLYASALNLPLYRRAI